jgi:hypothetical protein
MTRQSRPTSPKRDLLPSSRPDHFTRALDETYERGFVIGRAAGLERACELLREAHKDLKPISLQRLIELLTKDKYRPS